MLMTLELIYLRLKIIRKKNTQITLNAPITLKIFQKNEQTLNKIYFFRTYKKFFKPSKKISI
jgi:hypothetical protein